jgi:hypothetical protein
MSGKLRIESTPRPVSHAQQQLPLPSESDDKTEFFISDPLLALCTVATSATVPRISTSLPSTPSHLQRRTSGVRSLSPPSPQHSSAVAALLSPHRTVPTSPVSDIAIPVSPNFLSSPIKHSSIRGAAHALLEQRELEVARTLATQQRSQQVLSHVQQYHPPALPPVCTEVSPIGFYIHIWVASAYQMLVPSSPNQTIAQLKQRIETDFARVYSFHTQIQVKSLFDPNFNPIKDDSTVDLCLHQMDRVYVVLEPSSYKCLTRDIGSDELAIPPGIVIDSARGTQHAIKQWFGAYFTLREQTSSPSTYGALRSNSSLKSLVKRQSLRSPKAPYSPTSPRGSKFFGKSTNNSSSKGSSKRKVKHSQPHDDQTMKETGEQEQQELPTDDSKYQVAFDRLEAAGFRNSFRQLPQETKEVLPEFIRGICKDLAEHADQLPILPPRIFNQTTGNVEVISPRAQRSASTTSKADADPPGRSSFTQSVLSHLETTTSSLSVSCTASDDIEDDGNDGDVDDDDDAVSTAAHE